MQKIKNYFNTNTGFSLLAIGWVFLAIILPILIINNNYHLFVKGEDKTIVFTGWALVVLIIAFVGVYALLSYIISAYENKWRYWVQILKGFQKVILPLILFYLACDIAYTNIETIKNVVWWIMFSEILAILINPFPHWVYKRKNADTREIFGLGGKD